LRVIARLGYASAMANDALSRLLDERACERLVIDYTHLVDFGEAARIADLFTEDELVGRRLRRRRTSPETFSGFTS
jgi:hypothetical protein